MSTQTLRRFLQAPDKLRLPVVAPLVLGTICAVVLIATVVFEGVFPFSDAMLRQERTLGNAIRTYFRTSQLERVALGEMAWDAARDIDRAVVQGAKDDREIAKGTFRGWMLSKPVFRQLFGADPKLIRDLAENRLKKLSGKAPAWAATARLCEEGAARYSPGTNQRFQWNYTWGIAEVAQAYTEVLGREVKAADLLPLVPDGRCE